MSVMDLPRYGYAGVNPLGVKVSGTSLVADIAARIEEKHRVGWPELAVTALSDGRVVGGIVVNDEGERVWWAES